jgi:hypothetical protein
MVVIYALFPNMHQAPSATKTAHYRHETWTEATSRRT